MEREEFERPGMDYGDKHDAAAPPRADSSGTLKPAAFMACPHLNTGYLPGAPTELMEGAGARVDVPLYAIADRTATRGVGAVEVVSEGEWKMLDG